MKNSLNKSYNITGNNVLLLQKEERYQRLLESTSVIPWEADAQTGKFIYIGPQAKKVFGYPIQEWYGDTFWQDHIHPDDRQWAFNFCINASQTKKEYEFEYRMLTKKGQVVWIHDIVSVITKEDGKKVLTGFFVDITKRKFAEERLKESEEKFRSLSESSPIGIFLTDEKGLCTYTNKRCQEICGFTFNEALGQGWAKFVVNEDINYVLPKWTYAIENAINYEQEFRFKHKDGTIRWVFIRSSPMFSNDGKLIGRTGTAEDVTERKKADDALKRVQHQMKALYDANIIGVVYGSLSGPMYDANNAFLQMIGYSRKDLEEGKLNWTKITPKEKMDVDEKAVNDILTKGYTEAFEKEYIRKDGTRVPVIAGAALINKETMEGVAFILDNTDRKRLDRQKDEFLAMASHELKTPITSIKVYTQVLGSLFKKKREDKYIELITKMDSQIYRLTNLINDLLDVTKIQTGKLQFNESYFDINRIIQDLVEELQYTTNKHKIIHKLAKIDKIYGDKDRIGQVLTNLISNAIKYSPNSNKIVIKSRIKDNLLVISIKDFGIGIPKDKKDKIFERYFRVDDLNEDKFTGLGLGLYISNEIIKRQGGKIWVKSEEGKGSTFYFSLPINK